MPLNYSRRLTGSERSQAGNRELALWLAFIAGATNAGGFLAVHQYTSHMTGVVSSMADNLAVGSITAALAGIVVLGAFIAGSATTAVLVNYSRRRMWKGEYAIPLLAEAALLGAFGLLGAQLPSSPALLAPTTVMVLCFIMGLQNAVISKISRAEIRTTHVTGMVTDLGIELGKALYWNRDWAATDPVRADRRRLKLLLALLTSFFVGGLAGAFGFKHLGFVAALPLAIALIALAIAPVLDDVRAGGATRG